MGISIGYWASFVTMASEQFGTNLRATVTSTAPNFVRGALIPVTLCFEFFVKRMGIINAGMLMMCIVSGLAIFSALMLKESFSKDLNYFEE